MSPITTLSVTADIEVLVGLQPPTIALGEVGPGTRVTRRLALVGKHAGDVKVTGAGAVPHLEARVKHVVVDGRPYVELVLAVDPKAPVGRPVGGILELTLDGPVKEPARLNVSAWIAGSVMAKPARVYARPRPDGEPVQLTFQVLQRDGKPLSVKSVRDPKGIFTAKAFPVDASTVRIEARATGELPRSHVVGAFVVETRDRETPELEVPYTVIHQASPTPAVPARPLD